MAIGHPGSICTLRKPRGRAPGALDRRDGRGDVRRGRATAVTASVEPSLCGRELESFFRAHMLRLGPSATTSLAPSLVIAIGTAGAGKLETDAGVTTVKRGDTVLGSFVAGRMRLRSRQHGLELLRRLPSSPTGTLE